MQNKQSSFSSRINQTSIFLIANFQQDTASIVLLFISKALNVIFKPSLSLVPFVKGGFTSFAMD